MTLIEAVLVGPSKIPPDCTHLYSVPERSAPCSSTCWPLASISLLPDTCSCGAAPGLVAEVSPVVALGAGTAYCAPSWAEPPEENTVTPVAMPAAARTAAPATRRCLGVRSHPAAGL